MGRKNFSSTTGVVDQDTGKLETTPILGAPFWKLGVKVGGMYVRQFETSVGTCFEFLSQGPIDVFLDEKKRVAATGTKTTISRFAMGALKGFEIAVQKLDGFSGWIYGDMMLIECIGFQESQDEIRSDMPLFKLDISRQ